MLPYLISLVLYECHDAQELVNEMWYEGFLQSHTAMKEPPLFMTFENMEYRLYFMARDPQPTDDTKDPERYRFTEFCLEHIDFFHLRPIWGKHRKFPLI